MVSATITAKRAPTASQRILLVEDDEDSGLMLRYLLEMCGHDVRLTRTGAEALATAGVWPPQIVISDLGLRGDLDGLEVARALRAAGGGACSAYLIALSGFGREQDRSQTEAAGFNLHLTKPIDLDTLESVVARAVAARDCALPDAAAHPQS